jgi:hypothetical protein
MSGPPEVYQQILLSCILEPHVKDAISKMYQSRLISLELIRVILIK